jgi:hypothetical protein
MPAGEDRQVINVLAASPRRHVRRATLRDLPSSRPTSTPARSSSTVRLLGPSRAGGRVGALAQPSEVFLLVFQTVRGASSCVRLPAIPITRQGSRGKVDRDGETPQERLVAVPEGSATQSPLCRQRLETAVVDVHEVAPGAQRDCPRRSPVLGRANAGSGAGVGFDDTVRTEVGS